MKRILAMILTVFLLSGCDPGWSYRPHDPGTSRSGQYQYRFAETDGVETTVSCRLFSMGLTIGIKIVNHGPGSLSVAPELLSVQDARGNKLERVGGHCDASKDGEKFVLDAGKSCEVVGRFQVNPLSGPFPNPDLKNVTVVMDGLARDGKQIPLKRVLDKDTD